MLIKVGLFFGLILLIGLMLHMNRVKSVDKFVKYNIKHIEKDVKQFSTLNTYQTTIDLDDYDYNSQREIENLLKRELDKKGYVYKLNRQGASSMFGPDYAWLKITLYLDEQTIVNEQIKRNDLY